MLSALKCHALLQATKGKQKLAFFTMPEYEAWKETAAPGWTIKYYKGLGTSDKKEAQEYFADIDLHRKTFVHEGSLQLPALKTCASLACRPLRFQAWMLGGQCAPGELGKHSTAGLHVMKKCVKHALI